MTLWLTAQQLDKLKVLAKEYRRLKAAYDELQTQCQTTVAQMASECASTKGALASEKPALEKACASAQKSRTEVAKLSQQLMFCLSSGKNMFKKSGNSKIMS